jgi:colanic acid/amylovoran biosynthesis protein WcaK/AmsJ
LSSALRAPATGSHAPVAGEVTVAKRICVFGASLDVSNRGVLALGASVAQLFDQVSPGAAIVFHYGNRTGGTRTLSSGDRHLDITIRNCRMSPRSRPSEHILVILALALLYRLGLRVLGRRNAWLRSLLTADLVGEICGGDSFSDIYGFRRFVSGCLPLASAAILGRPYVMLPQTYGPFRHAASRVIARWLLRRARALWTRDRHCEAIVYELCGRTPAFCPDVAFTMEATEPETLPISPSGLALGAHETVIGVNVSGLLYMGGYTGRNMFGLRSEYRQTIDGLIAQLLASTSAKVLLVPHEYGAEKEVEACEAILDAFQHRFPDRIFMLAAPLNERELKWVIGRTQFFIGSRMHACIAALSQHVPAVGLAYSAKFLGVFQSAGVGDGVIDLRTVETNDAVAKTLATFEERTEFAKCLREQMPVIRAHVMDVFRAVLT